MIISVDPGKSGGIAWKNSIGKTFAVGMPETDGDIISLFNTIATKCTLRDERSVCYMEKVGGYIAGGKKPVVCLYCKRTTYIKTGQPGSAMFGFGYGNGFLVSTIMTRKIPLELVTPQKWQKLLGLGKKGDMTKTEWGNKKKALAQRLYPEMKITLKTADALLILRYGLLISNMVSHDYSSTLNIPKDENQQELELDELPF